MASASVALEGTLSVHPPPWPYSDSFSSGFLGYSLSPTDWRAKHFRSAPEFAPRVEVGELLRTRVRDRDGIERGEDVAKSRRSHHPVADSSAVSRTETGRTAISQCPFFI